MIDDKRGITNEEIAPLYSWIYRTNEGLYWYLKVRRYTGFDGELGNEEDYSWGYKVFFEDRFIWRGCIKGFLEIVPNPEEFFLDFLQSLNHVLIGVSKYAIPNPFSPIPDGDRLDKEDQRGETSHEEISIPSKSLDQSENKTLNPRPITNSRDASMGVGKKTIRRKTSIKGKTTKTTS